MKNNFSTFQYYINNKLHNFLNVFIIVYIDNILIYLFTLSKHWRHVQMIFEQLQEIDLQCDIKKCKFYMTEMMYFRLIVFQKKFKMNLIKIKIIINWENSQNIHNQFAICLLKKFINKFWIHCVKISNFWSCLLNQYMILKSKHDKYSAHHVCQCVNCFIIMKYCRFLWSIRTCIRNMKSSNLEYHCSKYYIITSSFLSYIS